MGMYKTMVTDADGILDKSMGLMMVGLLIGCILAVVGLAGYGVYYGVDYLIHRNDPPKWSSPYNKCLHHSTTTSFIMSGKVMVPVVNSHCDSYSNEIYIDLGNRTFVLKEL